MNKYGVAGKFIPIAAAPSFRAVDQHSGEVAPRTMPAALQLLDHVTKDRDALVEKVQEALTQRDNLVNLTIEVGRLGAYLKDVLAERDDAERECGELREALDAARCRLQELEGSDRQRADDL